MLTLYIIWGINWNEEAITPVCFKHTKEDAEYFIKWYTGDLALYWEKKELTYV